MPICTYEVGSGPVWYHPESGSASSELEAYLRDRAQQVDGDPTNLEVYSMESLKRIVAPYRNTWDLEDMKDVLSATQPFKPCNCNVGTACCGVCTKVCSRRCVQDLMHKLYVESFTNEEVREVLSNPMLCVYHDLCDLWNRILKERTKNGGTREKYYYGANLKFDLAKGRYAIDDTTGRVIPDYWPSSGLCPFCLSNEETTVYRRGLGPTKIKL